MSLVHDYSATVVHDLAAIDRGGLLKPIRSTAGSRRRRRRRPSMGRQIPARTYSDWNRPPPGFLEIDLVAHCGGTLSGSFIHGPVATDICTGWTEAVPLLAREQSLVIEGLEAIAKQLPFPILGIDSDNDGAFINETLVRYCAQRGIEFTRSRAYRKNDQTWTEQKNGFVVRRFTGHDRYSGRISGQTMIHLYQAVRLYVNYFQPSFKLLEKLRDGAKTIKRYSPPATPCDRLMREDSTSEQMWQELNKHRAGPDPVELLRSIREAQSALAAMSSPAPSDDAHGESLERFLARLPSLWQQGEPRPTHQERVRPPRHWRTRKDPFEGVWCNALLWLERDPDTTAKDLMARLSAAHPERFSDTQLRTLQRRVKDWRGVMARKLSMLLPMIPYSNPETEANWS